jgi:NitT/TauT family transport system ATP-binding protein
MEAYPYQLSAGQQQQVALLRTLAYDPHVILMDEPFSSLDYQTRLLSQDQLQRIWLETRKTVFFVSHDVDEAIYLADRLILLSQRPATIREVFRIPLPRPRDHTVLEGEAFFAIRSKVLSQYQEVIRQ